MRKKQLLADRQAMLDELSALQQENLRLRIGTPRSPPPVPFSPEEEEARAARQSAYSRFPKLRDIDAAYTETLEPSATLPGQATHLHSQEEGVHQKVNLAPPQAVAEQLRRYAGTHFGLYANRALFAHFLGAMAAAEVLLVRGEDEEESLLFCQAMAAALGQRVEVTQVQPHWRGSADLLGAMAPGGKHFDESDFLCTLYRAHYQDSVCFAVLRDIDAAPPAGYLRALLPLLGLRRTEGDGLAGLRQISLCGTAWPGDPLLLREGNLPWPENLWLLGTFAPLRAAAEGSAGTEKTIAGAAKPKGDSIEGALRAAAMEFCVPAQLSTGSAFLAALAKPMYLPAAHLRSLFAHAAETYVLPGELLRRYGLLRQYLADHLDLSMGAAADRQLERFGSVCLACGLRPEELLDGFLYHKGLRCLEGLHPALLKYELPGLRRFLAAEFGKRGLPMTVQYLGRVDTNAQRPSSGGFSAVLR
ncbi:MAG: hypothetical protein LBB50_00925 [Oscillospiraceae bacterium]|jgi:hypothetical protein|nr:hypothetical protein [Oscillospiraceae bacterium]